MFSPEELRLLVMLGLAAGYIALAVSMARPGPSLWDALGLLLSGMLAVLIAVNPVVGFKPCIEVTGVGGTCLGVTLYVELFTREQHIALTTLAALLVILYSLRVSGILGRRV